MSARRSVQILLAVIFVLAIASPALADSIAPRFTSCLVFDTIIPLINKGHSPP